MVATRGKGEKISLISTGSDEEESNAICDAIKSEIKLNKSTFKDFAVLYRTNAQSRSIEQAMVKEGIPYNINMPLIYLSVPYLCFSSVFVSSFLSVFAC